MSNLAKNLEYLLFEKRLSANQLQEQSGITQSTTTRILNGKTTNPRQHIIDEYAKFFGVSARDLVYGDLEDGQMIDLSTLPQRIQLALDHRNTSWSKAAISLGLSAQAAIKWKKGQIGKDTLHNLAGLLKVDYTWLATGEGEMQTPLQLQVTELVNSLPSAITHDQIPPDRASIAIPIYDVQFCCGNGVYTPEFVALKKFLPFDQSFFTKRNLDPNNFKLISATGDSMASYINKGDAVGIDVSDITPKDEQVYALCLDGDLMIKRIFKEGNGVLRLSSDNKANDYPDKVVTADSPNLMIIGKVIYRSG